MRRNSNMSKLTTTSPSFFKPLSRVSSKACTIIRIRCGVTDVSFALHADLQVKRDSYFRNWSWIVSARQLTEHTPHNSRRTLVDVRKFRLLLTISFHQSTVPTLVLVWNTCCPLGVVITPEPLLLGLLLWTELPFRSVPEVVVKLARS